MFCVKQFTCLYGRHLCILSNSHVQLVANSFYSEPLPRITVPQAMVQRYEQEKRMRTTRWLQHQESLNHRRSGAVIVSCKRKMFNHYKGPSVFRAEDMTSRGWKNFRKKGDKFTVQPFRGNKFFSLADNADSPCRFEDFDLDQRIINVLHKLNITKPTDVQAQTIDALSRGDHVLCSAETGSGKTLAYVIPILQRLQAAGRPERAGPRCSPSAVIFVPTAELAHQVENMSAALCSELGLRVEKGYASLEDLRQADVIVTTTGSYRKLLTRGRVDHSHLKYVIFDEADTLFDDSFVGMSCDILRRIQSHTVHGVDFENSGVQVALCSATIPTALEETLGAIIPTESFTEVRTRNVHQLMTYVPQTFQRVGARDKPGLLLERLKKGHTIKPTLIFTNRANTASFVYQLLQNSNVECGLLCKKSDRTERLQTLTKFQAGMLNVLVCTDLASRGLDTIRVREVINYDFPGHVSDYIHRAGRVGRVGSESGVVLSFVCRPYEVETVWKIEEAARKGCAIPGVDANIMRSIAQNMDDKALRMRAARKHMIADLQPDRAEQEVGFELEVDAAATELHDGDLGI